MHQITFEIPDTTTPCFIFLFYAIFDAVDLEADLSCGLVS